MAEESEIQKLKSKYPDFFNQFSSEFLKFVFSEETSLAISGICVENGIESEEIIDKITHQITLALFGRIQKENLVKILEKEAELNPVIAEKISSEAEDHVFSQAPDFQPAKSSLTETENVISPAETKPEIKPREKGKDTYREPIE